MRTTRARSSQAAVSGQPAVDDSNVLKDIKNRSNPPVQDGAKGGPQKRKRSAAMTETAEITEPATRSPQQKREEVSAEPKAAAKRRKTKEEQPAAAATASEKKLGSRGKRVKTKQAEADTASSPAKGPGSNSMGAGPQPMDAAACAQHVDVEAPGQQQQPAEKQTADAAAAGRNQGHEEQAGVQDGLEEDEDAGGTHELSKEAAAAAAAAKEFDPASRDHVSLVRSALNADVAAAASAECSTSGAPHGRQAQFSQLHSLLHKCCQEGLGRSIYISGLPGTGKSHTVRAVLSALEQQADKSASQPLAVFQSCFALKDPQDVYGALLSACQQRIASCSGKAGAAAAAAEAERRETNAERAHHQLVSLLQSCGKKAPSSKAAAKGSKGSAAGRMFVIVLDEVDRLLQRGTDDLYKLFMLPHVTGVRCCVVAMANSIDITERCLPALKCRGCSPEFVPFAAYSRPQVLSILKSKLALLPWPSVFDEAALELVARKVSGSTGDLRKAFQACRLALRLLHEQAAAAASAPAAAGAAAAGEEGAPSKPQGPIRVSAREMAAALARINYQSDAAAGHVNAIRNLPQQQQLHLLALATAVATAAAQAVAQAEADAAAREHGLSTDAYRAKYYWGPSSNVKQVTKAANPFAAAKTAGGAAPSPAPSGMRGGAGAPGTPSTPAASMLAGDSAREVALPKAYEHYRQICASMFQQPASEQEFRTTLELLSHVGLVGVSSTPSVVRRLGPGQSASKGGAAGGVQLALKAQIRDIQAALKDNAVFRQVLSSLPA